MLVFLTIEYLFELKLWNRVVQYKQLVCKNIFLKSCIYFFILGIKNQAIENKYVYFGKYFV